jgi:hypothetical protein
LQKGNIVADKFRVGQMVRIVHSAHPERIGLVVHIMSQKRWIERHIDYGKGFFYFVDIPPMPPANAKYASYREMDLEPVYDGVEKSSWSECAWKPKQDVLHPTMEEPTKLSP